MRFTRCYLKGHGWLVVRLAADLGICIQRAVRLIGSRGGFRPNFRVKFLCGESSFGTSRDDSWGDSNINIRTLALTDQYMGAMKLQD